MNISNNRFNFTFKSLNNPIKPFVIKGDDDEIKFEEVDYTKPQSEELLDNVSEFFLDNFVKQSTYPNDKILRKDTPDFNENSYKTIKKEVMKDPLKESLKDADTTLMLGFNKNKELVAGINTLNLNVAPYIQDNKTLYVDSLAVDKKYRGLHIGQTLINKVIESSKDKYTDVFLMSYNKSVPFYEKQNFNKVQDTTITETLSSYIPEHPEHMTFMERTINPNESRWTERINKNIDLLI